MKTFRNAQPAVANRCVEIQTSACESDTKATHA